MKASHNFNKCNCRKSCSINSNTPAGTRPAIEEPAHLEEPMAGKPKKPSQNDQRNLWYALHSWKFFNLVDSKFNLVDSWHSMLNFELLLQGG
jgi:hypothetical protein